MDPLLSLKAVSMSYWRGERCVRVLDGVSLDVHPGELVTVWGQHNSGKTTLLKLAAGLAKPTEGSVSFAGRDLKDLSAGGLARLLRGPIALARPTGPNSAELRMRDYVGMALLRGHSHTRARRLATAALERVGAGQCAAARWRDLSDSDRTLVALAHALVRSPRLLLLDDQTASLDDIQREDVMELLRTAAEREQLAVLATVPEMTALVHAHTIRSLSGGQLLAPADPQEREGEVIDFPAGGASRRTGAGGAPA
ncbi:MAG: ATP-binding cassette domain-containing protein [Solirubrobacteraceae bacterium]